MANLRRVSYLVSDKAADLGLDGTRASRRDLRLTASSLSQVLFTLINFLGATTS